MKSCLVLLLALSAAALVSARVFSAGERSLQQLPTNSAGAFCPAGCDRLNGGCVQDATMAGLRCQKCLGSLLVNKVNGNCSCPAGKYATASYQCVDCPKGSYCLGGDYTTNPLGPVATACPGNDTGNATMTTIGKRTLSVRGCVQLPGFYYTFLDATGLNVSTVKCPVDTYSPGLKKQRACVPCPTGFTTNGLDGQSSPTACLVPAGYYLKAPGQVAPCPKGEFKEKFGPNGNCTKCAFGVTTPAEGSISVDNCTILLPGYFAAAMNGSIVTSTVICPQGWYCPGGSPAANTPFNASAPAGDALTIIKCAGDAWTVDVGAQSPDQCLIPPGYFFNGTTTLKCAAGSYRADWKPSAQAPSCTSCGVGVKAAMTDQIKVYDILDANNQTNEAVTTSADDCYILPGQGLYYTSTTATWRARNCDTNNYGVSKITYGLTPAPCRDCPTNMVAINNATYSNSAQYYTNNSNSTDGGFTNVAACVTIDGYGYNGRVAQACAKGFYNAKNNYEDCKPCDYGLTTADVGAGITAADCGMANGFGFDGSVIRECPIGTYNNQTWQAKNVYSGPPVRIVADQPCTACSVFLPGTTTQATGSDKSEQCNLCLPGYGGVDCNMTCGGTTWPGTYGPAGRSWTDANNTDCVACTTQTTGYSFEWNMANDVVAVPAISKSYASASGDCLSQFAQIYDGAWFLPITPNGTLEVPLVATFQLCLDLCIAYGTNCQYVTYDYMTATCYIRYQVTQVYVGAPVIGFKNVPSGDVATNAWKLRKSNKAKGLSVASGQYTFYQDPNALEIGKYADNTTLWSPGAIVDGEQEFGGQKAAPNRRSFTKWQDCLSACDDDVACTAFIIQLRVVVADRPSTCRLVYGNTILGEFKRSMTRADILRLSDPSGNLK